MLIARSSFEDVVWGPLVGTWKRRGCPTKAEPFFFLFPSVLYRYSAILLQVYGNKGNMEKEVKLS